MTAQTMRMRCALPATRVGPVSPHVVFDAFQNSSMQGRDDGDIAPGRAMLAQARHAGWPISHILRRPPDTCFDPDDPLWRPIDGFEPWACEMSFVTTGRTAFASRPFTERFLSLRPYVVFYLSLATRENCLETLAFAEEKGLPFTLVSSDPLNCVCQADKVAYSLAITQSGEMLESQSCRVAGQGSLTDMT